MNAEHFFEQIQKHFELGLPFACFSKSGKLKAYLQSDDNLNLLEDFQSSGFVFCPFTSHHSKVIFPSKYSKVLNSKLIIEESQILKNRFKIHQDDKTKHLNLVGKAINQIKYSDLKKVICSRKIKVSSEVHSLDIFKNLGLSYPEAYSYCWFHPKIGLWLGATPEQFLLIERNQLKTVALAGTIDAEKHPEPEWSEKEIEEQQMVTDFVVKALKTSTKDLVISPTETVRAGRLWHLKTLITSKVEKDKLKNIIESLHPTSAVCGLPKTLAEAFIINNETYDREYYTGFLGELNVKQEIKRNNSLKNQEQSAIKSIRTFTDLHVNLRCMKKSGDDLEIFVGGGITKDSQPEAEYEETVSKSQTLLNVL